MEQLTDRLMRTAYNLHNVSPSGHRCRINAVITNGIQNTPKEENEGIV